ncbi:hypothetical protein ACFSSA_00570 [Luteolibacter algae]|uniref:Uncharacterized protein n=1 Tax=Luteolibacter algae TaxID=454151 RepID=A0ABW5D365_9BACT
MASPTQKTVSAGSCRITIATNEWAIASILQLSFFVNPAAI